MTSRRKNSSLVPPGRSAYGAATAAVLVLIPVLVLAGGDTFREFLDFGAGVLSLVSLSCSVIWGLVAQDRILLNARQRIVGQAVHRATAVAAIAFLLLHVTTKLALDHVEPIAAVLPFSLGVTGSAGLIGLGSLAGLLMVFVGITGALRGAFASPAPVAARWRTMHMLAYPAWCAALLHGLFAGRQAKPVFVFLYGLSLVAVIAALALRSAPRPVKREVADRLIALLGGGERPGREDLDAARARAGAEPSPLPGYDVPRGDRERPAEPAAGFAAAYRAVSRPRRSQHPVPDAQPTESLPRMDTASLPRVDTSWPIPSPPPVGEAPPSAYDPLQDTGYTIPPYDNPGTGAYGRTEMFDTVESNTLYGTYNPNDTYDNSGPATETLPGASYDFDAPGSGEPWNMPSGGFK
ncbi:cytochrome b/b6 domain-containing protein [Streptomyces sp.]|uniref:cytochrome b/b6 domain-containing protein n=1 Tax=Streptomyces sp. TaxID=1931 RepID=UPI002D61BAED|nr:cytochrome b/b6 domain-containing protein [Streptomyces sp.]HZF88295.1 cytochrome b/b6 domain-containing protein [Streptomyces sp.]